MLDRVQQLPPWAWLVVAGIGGLGFLCWHSFERAGDEDPEWLDPGQPPAQVALPLVPGAHGTGAPMAYSDAFRGRAYADVLPSLRVSIGGELGC